MCPLYPLKGTFVEKNHQLLPKNFFKFFKFHYTVCLIGVFLHAIFRAQIQYNASMRGIYIPTHIYSFSCFSFNRLTPKSYSNMYLGHVKLSTFLFYQISLHIPFAGHMPTAAESAFSQNGL